MIASRGGASCDAAWKGLDDGIMGAENGAVKRTDVAAGSGRADTLSRAGCAAGCAECGTTGDLSGFRSYFQAKVCLRPPICTSNRPGSTTDLFWALMNDKSSLVNSKV